jgi:hypothetical protein
MPDPEHAAAAAAAITITAADAAADAAARRWGLLLACFMWRPSTPAGARG